MKTKNFPIKQSTKEFWQNGKEKEGFTFFDQVHGHVYGRWPYLYISLARGEHPLARGINQLLKIRKRIFGSRKPKGAGNKNNFAEGYHGKVMPLESAKELVSVKEDINIADLEKVIPYDKAREIVLKNPDHIVALDCPCRLALEHHCEPVDVCLIVGEPFASFIIDHHPRRSRWITQEEAADILEAENKRGHVHHAFFKDAMLGRFYAICNCCSCCCAAINAHKNGTPMLASSGFLAEVDQEKCVVCGVCVNKCAFGALSVTDKVLNIDTELCMGCGACVNSCPNEALALKREPSKGEPLEIFSMMEEAAKV